MGSEMCIRDSVIPLSTTYSPKVVADEMVVEEMSNLAFIADASLTCERGNTPWEWDLEEQLRKAVRVCAWFDILDKSDSQERQDSFDTATSLLETNSKEDLQELLRALRIYLHQDAMEESLMRQVAQVRTRVVWEILSFANIQSKEGVLR